LRQRRPSCAPGGDSATIGNLQDAARAAVGAAGQEPGHRAPDPSPPSFGVATEIPAACCPRPSTGFPWGRPPRPAPCTRSGGKALDRPVSTLLFTNHPQPGERWHQCLRSPARRWRNGLPCTTGSIGRGEREAIEAASRTGLIRWLWSVPSSLDLGVDFQAGGAGGCRSAPARTLARRCSGPVARPQPGGTSQVLVHAHQRPGAAGPELSAPAAGGWSRGW